MPTRSKKKTTARFVELNLNLKVPRKQYSMVEEALTAVLDLAGLKLSSEKTEKPKKPSAPKPGRPPKAKPVKAKSVKAKPVKAKPGPKKKAKPAKAKPAPGRKTAAKKFPKTAALIRTLRTEAGFSQKFLADKLGVRQNTISLLETGRQKPNLDMAVKLGQMLNTSYQNLLE